MPAIPLAAWLNFLAFRILVSRLSFVGANGILLVTTGIAFAGTLGLPPAGIAGVLLTIAAAEQLLTAVFVGVPWLIGARVACRAGQSREIGPSGGDSGVEVQLPAKRLLPDLH